MEGVAPADRPVEPGDDVGPDRAADALPGRGDAERQAPVAVEPAHDVRHQRREHAGIAEKADQHAENQHQLSGRLDIARQEGAGADRERADQRDIAHAEAFGERAEIECPDPGAEKGGGVAEGGQLARPAHVLGNRLQLDIQHEHRPLAEEDQQQRREADYPGIAAGIRRFGHGRGSGRAGAQSAKRKLKPSPALSTWPQDGAGKCAGISSAGVSATRSSTRRRVTAACSGHSQKDEFQCGS